MIPRLGTYLKEHPDALKERAEGKEQERGSGTEECRANRDTLNTDGLSRKAFERWRRKGLTMV